MSEKKIVIEKEEIMYDGLFNLKLLFKEIDQFFRQHGYDRYEEKHNQQVTNTGRQVYIRLVPWKSVSDYAKLEIRLDMTARDIKDVEVDHEGVKEILQKGNLHFVFQARIITDYENKWESTPIYTFIRTLIDKFVHKTQLDLFDQEVIADTQRLKEEIKAFLNLFRYKV